MTHNLLYKPLDKSRNEIRLVTILPSENEDEPVACRLETASLTDELEYVAMSYVWGDPSVTEDIVVNALPHELRLNILSSEDSADGGSTEVGKDDSNGEVNDPYNLESELIQVGLKWITGQPTLHHDMSKRKPYDAWNSFAALTKLPYWRRVWIHQERALSKSSSRNLIRCGAELATWEDFVFFFSVIRAFGNKSVRPPEIHSAEWFKITTLLKALTVAFTAVRSALWKSGLTVPYRVPVVAEVSEATDPRDMVYGLQSLLNLDLEVNYEKSVRQVYLDWHAEATAQSLEGSEVKVDLISRAGIGLYEENEHNLPSWLPNLRAPREQYYSEDGVLSVYGAVCDQVTRTDVYVDDPDNLLQSLRELGTDYVSYMKEKDHPAGVRPLQALYYTVHQGIDPYTGQRFARELNPQSAAAQAFRLLCAFDLPTTTTEPDRSYVDPEAAGGLAAHLESRFRDCGDAADTERWRRAEADISLEDRGAQVMEVIIRWAYVCSKAVFYTARGYIGIGPRYTQVGDRLCVIDNCSLPVLLRMEGSVCRLVGAAYAYGLSETQPRETIQSGGFKLEKFEIH
ncbi:hypothetical protein DL770_008053 [Monosporascus sp. CRB-9-2]|nr:hypothetical protein DL770_008053 [Monosporascus sp. CRB-9-2]